MTKTLRNLALKILMLKLKHKNLNAHTAEEINTFMCVCMYKVMKQQLELGVLTSCTSRWWLLTVVDGLVVVFAHARLDLAHHLHGQTNVTT